LRVIERRHAALERVLVDRRQLGTADPEPQLPAQLRIGHLDRRLVIDQARCAHVAEARRAER
jgi:hypothetical protein